MEINCEQCEDTGFVYEVDLDTLMSTGLTEYTIRKTCPACMGDGDSNDSFDGSDDIMN